MNVTKVEKQKKGKRYNIYIDEQYSFSADDEDVIKYSLKEGTILDKSILDDIINECEYSKAYNYSLNLMSIKDYLSSELKNKLKKQFSEQTVNKVITRLKEYNFIDDDKYIKRYINDHIKLKKEGFNKVCYDLKRKGADISLINEEDYYDVLLENALYIASKKYSSINKDDKNLQNKVYRYLQYHGYNYDIIKKVMVKLFNFESD